MRFHLLGPQVAAGLLPIPEKEKEGKEGRIPQPLARKPKHRRML